MSSRAGVRRTAVARTVPDGGFPRSCPGQQPERHRHEHPEVAQDERGDGECEPEPPPQRMAAGQLLFCKGAGQPPGPQSEDQQDDDGAVIF